MASTSRRKKARLRRPSLPAMAAIGLLLTLSLTAGIATGAARLVPTVGSYKASGRGDPPRYEVRAQVKRKAGHATLSAQVDDTCGGFATFAHVAIAANSKGAPEFSARVGGAAISGRWTAPTTIKGSVKSPCAKRQDYVMRLTG
jgi:hypothetical protein